MTLHEAIDAVLREHGQPMTTRELADAINRSGSYVRPSDARPLQANQVAARVRRPTYRDRYVIGDDFRVSLAP